MDPEWAELVALAQIVDFSGLRVVEIGCGNGCLTWPYAGPVAKVLGIDLRLRKYPLVSRA